MTISLRFRAALVALLLVFTAVQALGRSLPETRPDRVGLDPDRLDRIAEQMNQAVADGVMVGRAAYRNPSM